MSEKRKDSKGRILRDNESQRKDGRYEFKYVDRKGGRHSIYSWRLVPTDKTPAGKRHCDSLREMEKQIALEGDEPVSHIERKRATLNTLFREHITTKTDLRDTTRSKYKYAYNRYVYDDIGMQPIADIHFSDIKRFYTHLLNDTGLKPNTIDNINTIIHPVFESAVRDGLITTNPTDGAMVQVKRSCGWVKPKRKALTIPQQKALMSYVSNSIEFVRWKPLLTVLLGTGCRIGEALGLRWDDCDFENGIINVNHTLNYQLFDDGKTQFKVTTPKTRNGVRQIPMLSDVREVLQREYERQSYMGFNKAEVDGYTNFIFVNRFGDPFSSRGINQALDSIRRNYNVWEKAKAEEEGREPLILPDFTCHNLRHTFCTRFCENETNLKVIQEIMGHANISTTMDVYNEATMEKKVASFENLEGKLQLQ